MGRSKGYHIFGTAKVGEKGQIVIPKEARKIFGIEAGDTLLILGDEKNGIIVSKPEVIEAAAEELLRNMQKEDQT
ncbi:MAG: AbrB/MazE/SpoVT family DNA-binding domain-containing protein [Oscillospiraceae bacterium]|nr:AbrB/MazE/SpoVT family DNA-binding domain-containing protein [Oscillospiraceae bacterium]